MDNEKLLEILKRIDESIALYTRVEEAEKTSYLTGLRIVCVAIIDYIKKYAAQAKAFAEKETDASHKKLYEDIANDCEYIAENPPKTFHQAVQWIHFAIMTDRIVGHGNGYGRLDLYLNDFYQNDLKNGIITRQDAREYLAEMFLKFCCDFYDIIVFPICYTGGCNYYIICRERQYQVYIKPCLLVEP